MRASTAPLRRLASCSGCGCCGSRTPWSPKPSTRATIWSTSRSRSMSADSARRGEYPLQESSPLPVTLVLLGLQAGAGRGAAPEREPDSPFQDSFLVEGQGLGENRAERLQAAARPDRREHPFSGGPVDLPQGGDQDLFLVREVVSDPSGGAARLLGDPSHRGGLDSFGRHDRPGGSHELAAPLRVVDHLRHRPSLQNNCCASTRRRLTMHNMCCASGLTAVDDAAIGVFGFIGRGGRPLSCAVTPLP